MSWSWSWSWSFSELERKVRDGAKGCERVRVWVVRKSDFRERIVGGGGIVFFVDFLEVVDATEL